MTRADNPVFSIRKKLVTLTRNSFFIWSHLKILGKLNVQSSAKKFRNKRKEFEKNLKHKKKRTGRQRQKQNYESESESRLMTDLSGELSWSGSDGSNASDPFRA